MSEKLRNFKLIGEIKRQFKITQRRFCGGNFLDISMKKDLKQIKIFRNLFRSNQTITY